MAKRIRKRNNRPAQQAVQFALPPDAPHPPQDTQLIRTRHALSGWPMILGWLAMLIFTIYACTHMVAAGDTWVAMACGRHFVNHGVDTNEPFSANSHRQGPTQEEIDKTWPAWAQWITEKVGLETVKKWHPTGWVNQNWLTHVIFYLLVPKDSYADGVSFPSNALVYWKFTIYIISVACVFYCGVLLGVNPALSAVFSCFAMFIGRSFLDIRPAGFSNMLVAVFGLILVLATYRNILYIWLIVPLTVFWCNVHGGYIYVFIMLIPFILWHAMILLPKRWTISVYSILAWMVLYALAYKALNHEHLKLINPRTDWFFYLLMLFIAANVALSINKQVKNDALYTYHFIISVIVFLSLLPRFFPAIPHGLTPLEEKDLKLHIFSSQLTFVAIFLFIVSVKLILTAFKDKMLFSINLKGICHTLAAGFVAFVAMVVFNPFHFTNLTHTFVISVSKHAERWRDIHEWHPAFEWSNPVGTAIPFACMYAIAWAALAAWIVVMLLASGAVGKFAKRKASESHAYRFPRLDFSLIVIAALTIYMAIRSRRFIPIAAVAACPVIAMLIDQLIRAVAATYNFRRQNRLQVPPMSEFTRRFFITLASVVLLLFSFWPIQINIRIRKRNIHIPLGVVLRFKHVYLDPWPNDPELASVFMRMTASDAKPFYATTFMKMNRLKGKMFNYWTEGGLIAWGQEPDPNTGHTPLQLFMDGRAQAAYNTRTFDLWTMIMSGGPTVSNAWQKARLLQKDIEDILTVGDYKKIGVWVSEQLRGQNVWLVLMPAGQFSTPFTKGLDYISHDWPLVLLNNKEKIFVDVNSPQGKQLFYGVNTGQTLYPDDFHKNLVLGHTYLLQADLTTRIKGFDFVKKAFEENRSPAPMLEMILIAARTQELIPQITEFCKSWVDDFEKNKDKYRAQNGYRLKLEAARLACIHLEKAAQAQKDAKRPDTYVARMRDYTVERDGISETKRW